MALMKALCYKGQNACLICQNQGNAMADARHKRGPDQLTGITFLPKPAALFSAKATNIRERPARGNIGLKLCAQSRTCAGMRKPGSRHRKDHCDRGQNPQK